MCIELEGGLRFAIPRVLKLTCKVTRSYNYFTYKSVWQRASTEFGSSFILIFDKPNSEPKKWNFYFYLLKLTQQKARKQLIYGLLINSDGRSAERKGFEPFFEIQSGG